MNPDAGDILTSEQSVKKDWWLLIVVGAAMVLVGIFAAAAPFATAVVLTLVLGWVLVFGGIAHVIHGIRTREHGGLVFTIIVAALYVIAGILLLTRPLSGVLTLSLLLGIFLVVDGLVKTFTAIQLRALPSWGWTLVNGLLSVVLGVIIWTQWPIAGMWVLGVFVGIELIVSGAVMISTGFALRPSEGTPATHPV